MGLYDDDYTSSQAYQENVALPDQRAWAREAEARGEQMINIEEHKSGYRCVHEEERYHTRRAIVVEIHSGFPVLVDMCPACMAKIKAARRG